MTTSPASQAPKLIAVLALSLLICACSASAAGSTWTFVPPQPTASGAAGSPGASGAPSSGAPSSGAPSGAPASAGASSAPSSPSGSQAPGSPGASGGGSGTTIALEETSQLSITQNGQPVKSLTVKKGETITFQITNSAGFDHDFYIGTPDQLSNNQTSGLQGIPAFESGTQTFTYTVTDDTANLQFACTLPGHYQLMHGTFTVQP